jgi:hypothetical protein
VAGDGLVTLSRPRLEVAMRVFLVVLFVWLLIGALAAGQRHYFSGSSATCAGVGTILVTIVFGPVNYFGANPKLTCQ